MRLVQPQGIVAAIEELDLGAEELCRALGLVLAAGLHRVQRRARLLPGELALAALAERHANDLHAKTLLRMQRNGAPCPPDEIAGMGCDHKTCLHGTSSPFINV